MPNILKELELGELSLVDNPANPLAKAPLFKRDSEGELMKNEDIETMKADLEVVKTENERLRKSLIDNGFVIKADVIEKKTVEEMIMVGGEEVAKSAIPAPVLKALEAAAVEKADTELTKRADEVLPHFEASVAKELVKAFDDNEAIMAALIAADKAFEDTMREFGKAGNDDSFATAEDQIESLVKAHMEANALTKKDYAKAYAAVVKTDEGKALLNKFYKGE